MTKFGDDARAAVAHERKRDPGQRDDADDAADDDERLQHEAEGEADGEQLREAVLGDHRDAEAAQREHHVDEQEGGDADQPELLAERGEDEVGLEVGDERVPARVVNVPLPKPVPPKWPFAIEYRPCTIW